MGAGAAGGGVSGEGLGRCATLVCHGIVLPCHGVSTTMHSGICVPEELAFPWKARLWGGGVGSPPNSSAAYANILPSDLFHSRI